MPASQSSMLLVHGCLKHGRWSINDSYYHFHLTGNSTGSNQVEYFWLSPRVWQN
jgi:hypothetical protein